MLKRSIYIFFIIVFCWFVGFAINNYIQWYNLKHNYKPNIKEKKITRNLYDIPYLPYRITPEPNFQLLDSIAEKNDKNTNQSQEKTITPVIEKNTQELTDDSLEYKVNRAVNESRENYNVDIVDSAVDYTINELPLDIKNKIPKFLYNSHVFSSNKKDRFITINNKKLYEGDTAFGFMKLIKIEPNYAVFRVDGVLFSVMSLTDWNG